MVTAANFAELVRTRTEELADKKAYTFLREVRRRTPGTPPGTAETLTYAELDREARRIASRLDDCRAHGQRVLLLYPPGLDFIKAFTACLYAGAVAVPAPLPWDYGQAFTRVLGIVRDAGVRVVLTDQANAQAVSGWFIAEELSDIACLAIDDGEGDPGAWQPRAIDERCLAFLQYTSGSTSEPKGVMVSHGNLLANNAVIQRALGTTRDTQLGGWLPFYHDMGLMGHVLHPLYLGGSAALMSPVAFIKRPYTWLDMVGRHGIEVSAAPNFAYDLCVRRVTDEQLAQLDLSGWRVACNGGELVRAETLRSFSERFAPAGFRREAFYPCYGMSETTLFLSGGKPGLPPVITNADAAALERNVFDDPETDAGTRVLVSSGQAEGFDLRIVNPDDGRALPEGQVGEIWVRGPSVAQGYFGRSGLTRRAFGAATAGGERGFFRTGDLGFVLDGELHNTGREKEMLIINGRNIYPQDVERVIQHIEPAGRSGRGAVFGKSVAFTVEAAGERMVIVQEVRKSAVAGGDLRTLITAILQAVGRAFAAPAGNVVLVPPGTVQKTTSGKVQRAMMRELLLSGKLPAYAQVLDPAVSAVLGRPESEPAPRVRSLVAAG